VYRPEFYRPEDENLRGVAKINVAKQRNGPTGIVNLAFIREYARFADMEFQAFEA
jgi:replicative DNA helicase